MISKQIINEANKTWLSKLLGVQELRQLLPVCIYMLLNECVACLFELITSPTLIIMLQLLLH